MPSAMRSPLALLLLLFSLHAGIVAADDEEPSNYDAVVEAHGIMGCLAMVIFFPVGAILLRVLSGRLGVYSHAGMQLFALSFLTATAGMGIWMARTTDQLNTYHAIVGLIVFIFAWLQLFGGVVHHLLFKRHGRRSWAAHGHMRLGPIIITLGIINGGLGMMLGDDPTTGERVAYGVISGFIWLLWFGVMVWAEDKRDVALSGTASPSLEKNA